MLPSPTHGRQELIVLQNGKAAPITVYNHPKVPAE